MAQETKKYDEDYLNSLIATIMDTPTNNDLKAQARYLVEEMYQKGLRALEAELTVGNYEAQIAKIEKYKQIHR